MEQQPQIVSGNDTLGFDPDSPLYHCWRLNSCDLCMESLHPTCGWCPFTSTCIPAYSLLSPLTNPTICPSPTDRWELRTRTLGCNVSTRNLLSTTIATLLTTFLLLLLFIIYLRQFHSHNRHYLPFRRTSSSPSPLSWFTNWPFFSNYDNDNAGWSGWYPGWIFWKQDDTSRNINRLPGGWQDGPEDTEAAANTSTGGDGGVARTATNYGAITSSRGRRLGSASDGNEEQEQDEEDNAYTQARRRLLGLG